MSGTTSTGPEGAAGRCTPTEARVELPGDPHTEAAILNGIRAEAERLLCMKPNPKTVRSAGQRLHVAITAVVDDVARRKGGAR
ncbi:hypothetical protein GXW83_27525 [Streptacidiphilus sp. PB12-B1b]|uniref:hypothetical protein n=1 Tax=Streptacidiphilus sp. PB12-B1b TaxID=2705012 RepID=UPI0015F8FE0C|nr:hypothetical protein [Streptacidiphilus sp. PB12-B1b]QMU78896.1 hypothetical protein GXW83_27525 [Streptacidiphilus sp. PB12-B1b]